MLFLGLLLSLALQAQQQQHPLKDIRPPSKGQRCEPERIQLKQCASFYSFTSMPNLLKHQSQFQAQANLDTLRLLMDTDCSSQLRFFLCSMYAPMCDPVSRLSAGPCQELCIQVQQKCQAQLTSMGIAWPESLNCDHLPKRQKGVMCMPASGSGSSTFQPDLDGPRILIKDSHVDEVLCGHLKGLQKGTYGYLNRTNSCVIKCKTEQGKFGIFDESRLNVLDQMSLVLNSCIAVGAIFVAITASIASRLDNDRFLMTELEQAVSGRFAWWDWVQTGVLGDYPRSLSTIIGWIAACQGLHSSAFLIRLFMGRKESACDIYKQVGTAKCN
ncbi:Frizzled-4 [Cichlidogyrus casuarinus]|uniref:Frizzled-4 n=1 Tax=Cichlidogyrus casuarinus TaxID=1844966 RepID=A0ABD2Q6H3_9PLAT